MWSHEYHFGLAVSQMLLVGAGWRTLQPSWVLENATTMKWPALTRGGLSFHIAFVPEYLSSMLHHLQLPLYIQWSASPHSATTVPSSPSTNSHASQIIPSECILSIISFPEQNHLWPFQSVSLVLQCLLSPTSQQRRHPQMRMGPKQLQHLPGPRQP